MQTEIMATSQEMLDVDADILEALLDHPRVGVILPTRINNFQMECHVEPGIFPSLDVQLLPLQLKTDQLNLSGECVLFCEDQQSVLIARARIIESVTDRQIRVEVLATEKKAQQREFFRIDAEVCLEHAVVSHGMMLNDANRLQRVNLSGNGLRFATDLQLEEDELLQVYIDFKQPKIGQVSALGRVVRVFQTRTEAQEVAVELCELKESTQDKIVKFCIAEQTRQIRLKVLH